MRVKRDFCLDFSKKISTDFLVCLAGKFPSEISILRRPPKYRRCQSFSTFEFQLNRISNLILHLLEEVTCELNFFRISIIVQIRRKKNLCILEFETKSTTFCKHCAVCKRHPCTICEGARSFYKRRVPTRARGEKKRDGKQKKVGPTKNILSGF